MSRNKRTLLSCLLLATCVCTPAMESTGLSASEALINDFVSSDWERVYRAKYAFEAMEEKALPILVALLDQEEYKKLQNTADLIYPGAQTFSGHGWIVPYDLDWISARAGWALEDLTFQSFGFREAGLDHDSLLQAVMEGKRDVPLGNVANPPFDDATRKSQRQQAVTRATQWWEEHSSPWNRFDALLAALQSSSPSRQLNALEWIRHGETKCTSLTKRRYKREIFPQIEHLALSEDEDVRDQARYLIRDMNDGEWYWFEIKGTWMED